MTFAPALNWLPLPPPPGLGVPTTITPEKIESPVEFEIEIEQTQDEVIPGTIPKNGSVSEALGSIAKGYKKLANPALFAAVLGKGLDAGAEIAKGAPSTATSSATGKSGDINQSITFGDLIAKGYKFDLGSIPTWVFITAAVLGGLTLLKSKKKGRK